MTSTTLSQRLDRSGRWFDDNWRGVLLVGFGLVVGIGLGWWAGSWLSCSTSDTGCEVRSDSVGAAGTWVGGIGTILAVLAAVAAFRSEEASRRREAELEGLAAHEREKRVKEDARLVRIFSSANVRDGKNYTGFDVSVRNGTTETMIFNITLTGPVVTYGEEHHLGPGSHMQKAVRRAPSWSFPDGLDVTDKSAVQQWVTTNSSVTFLMHGRYWSRRGHNEPEIIDEWEVHGPDAPE